MIGVAVAVVVGTLHATKAIAGFEAIAAQLVSDYAGATKVVGEKWQYALVLVIALGVAWLSLSSVPRWRVWLLTGLLLLELFGLAWVCSLYRVFFQPAPTVLALVFAILAAEGWSTFLRRNRSHLIRTLFADRVSKEQFRRLSDGRISFDAEPKTYDVSVVVCDIGNKLTFAEGGEPTAFTETTGKFIRETAARLVEQGAYLQAADGEPREHQHLRSAEAADGHQRCEGHEDIVEWDQDDTAIRRVDPAGRWHVGLQPGDGDVSPGDLEDGCVLYGLVALQPAGYDGRDYGAVGSG